jgi:hypothetical protein
LVSCSPYGNDPKSIKRSLECKNREKQEKKIFGKEEEKEEGRNKMCVVGEGREMPRSNKRILYRG